ncbi:MAG: hypothetical protein PHR17_10260 [Aminobacterium sp.]|nr:hypothetical protein [Aminobacterium sp.]
MYALKVNKQRKNDYKETRNFKQLKNILIEASNSKSFEDAINEWAETNRYHVSDDGNNCICGKTNIREICIITNILSGIELTVGNCCINHFCDTDSNLFFRALAKISKDHARSANAALIKFAHNQKVFDNWEFAFYSNIWRKHNKSLSPKQLARKRYLNEKLLEAFKITNTPKGVR